MGGAAKAGGPSPGSLPGTPFASGAAPNPSAGEKGELGRVPPLQPPPRVGGCGGHPGWVIFQCCRCLRMRKEWKREEEKARAAQWVSPRPSPPAAEDAGPSGDEVALVGEVSLLLLG